MSEAREHFEPEAPSGKIRKSEMAIALLSATLAASFVRLGYEAAIIDNAFDFRVVTTIAYSALALMSARAGLNFANRALRDI